MTSLRVALTNLRKHLSPYVDISRDTVAINPEADVWSDATTMETLLLGVDNIVVQASDLSETVIEKEEKALALYQGEFLQGFSIREARLFEEWVGVERERLHYLVMDGLSQVVAWRIEQGDYMAGIQQATRWLQLDPLNEAAHQSMMRLLAYSGQTGTALRQYQECVQVLDEELGLTPSPETTELYESIQSHQLTPPVKSTTAVTVEKELPPEPGEPPFKGLSHYDIDDTHLFYGREELTAELVSRLKQEQFLAVVGASGSGKSSLVRAGLIPALRSGQTLADGSLPPQGSEKWPVHLMTPTARPLKALALSLTRGTASVRVTTALMDDLAQEPRSLDIYAEKLLADSPAQRLLLVVDQFEELFTQCRDEAEREAFVANLLTAATGNSGGSTIVVITLRADFYAHCARYDGLRELLEAHQAYIGQMPHWELRQAIQGPAAAGDWSFEQGLVDLLLHDVGANRNRKPEPGALPLLSHALLETWRRRCGRQMTFSSYAGTGGVRKAIAHTAEAVFNDELTAEQRPITRSIFVRLTELGVGTQDTRRRATLEELIPNSADAPAVEAVLGILADARLVTIGEGTAEVAHEALIREWPQLREWLDEDREGLRLHRQLTEAAQGWLTLDQDEGALYRGARLAQAAEWVQEHEDDPNPLEWEFLEASQALAQQEEAEREAQRQRELEAARTLAETEKRAAEQLRRRRRYLIGALAVASILAIVAVFFGIRFRQSAAETEQRSRLAQARELAALSVEALSSDPELSLLLAVEAVNMTRKVDQHTTSEAEVSLYRALTNLSFRGMLTGHTELVSMIEFSPDGTRLVTASNEGMHLWDEDGNHITSIFGETREGFGPFNWSASFSSDGERILTAHSDQKARLWDADGNLITTYIGHGQGDVTRASFSPDGERIVTASEDGTARLWEVEGNLIRILEGHTDRVVWASFSPNGKHIATVGRDATRLWDVEGNLITIIDTSRIGHTDAVSFSPDGERVLTGDRDGTPRLWDVEGNLISILEGHTDWVRLPIFSPDGKTILTASYDGTARLWNADGNFITTLEGHTDLIHQANFSPDGKRIVTASKDGTARLWDAQGNPLVIIRGHTDAVGSANFSPDGKLIVTGSADGTARLWEVEGSLLAQLTGHKGSIQSTTYDPLGERILTASSDGTAKIWEANGRLLSTLEGHTRQVWSATFNADGTRILTSGEDGTVRLWNAQGNTLAVFDNQGWAIRMASFSPDGKRILTTSDDGTPRLWESDGTFLTTLEGYVGAIRLVSFSPDGQRFVTAGHDINARLWDVSGTFLAPLIGHSDRISSVVFSQDGSRIVTAGQDETARLWDSEGNLLLALEGHTESLNSANFNPEGTHVVTASSDGTARLWDISAEVGTGEEGNPVTILGGHIGAVLWAGFSPDGRRIATVSQDGTARLWDEEGHFLAALKGHTGSIVAASFSPDGTQLVTASEDGSARVWQVWSDIDAMLTAAEKRVQRTLTEGECQLYLHLERCPP